MKRNPEENLHQKTDVALINRIFNPELAELYTERINSMIEERSKRFYNDKMDVENKIKEVEKQIDNLLDAIQAGCDIDVVKPRLNILSHKKEGLKAQLASIQEKSHIKKVSVEIIRDVLRNSEKVLQECDLEKKQRLFRSYLKKIVITDKDVEVYIISDNTASLRSNVGFPGAEGGSRTHMGRARTILSRVRLPIPPLRLVTEYNIMEKCRWQVPYCPCLFI
jgi:hypothetical protein